MCHIKLSILGHGAFFIPIICIFFSWLNAVFFSWINIKWSIASSFESLKQHLAPSASRYEKKQYAVPIRTTLSIAEQLLYLYYNILFCLVQLYYLSVDSHHASHLFLTRSENVRGFPIWSKIIAHVIYIIMSEQPCYIVLPPLQSQYVHTILPNTSQLCRRYFPRYETRSCELIFVALLFSHTPKLRIILSDGHGKKDFAKSLWCINFKFKPRHRKDCKQLKSIVYSYNYQSIS